MYDFQSEIISREVKCQIKPLTCNAYYSNHQNAQYLYIILTTFGFLILKKNVCF